MSETIPGNHRGENKILFQIPVNSHAIEAAEVLAPLFFIPDDLVQRINAHDEVNAEDEQTNSSSVQKNNQKGVVVGPVRVIGGFFSVLDGCEGDIGDVTDHDCGDDQREENVRQNGERFFLEVE